MVKVTENTNSRSVLTRLEIPTPVAPFAGLTLDSVWVWPSGGSGGVGIVKVTFWKLNEFTSIHVGVYVAVRTRARLNLTQVEINENDAPLWG
jgi:hypothetical protein